jgi:hypothetical protein
MVGAGFSLNADPVGPSPAPFPLWDELGSVFYRSLYPPADDPPSNDYRTATRLAAANGGVLRLAPLLSRYKSKSGNWLEISSLSEV